jgi:two-component system sensor histidine kinase VicK
LINKLSDFTSFPLFSDKHPIPYLDRKYLAITMNFNRELCHKEGTSVHVLNILYLAPKAARGITAFFLSMNESDSLFYLAERSTELFLIFDLTSNRFTYMNPAGQSFFNIAIEDANPGKLFNMIHDEDKSYVLANVDKCISGEIVGDTECRILRGKYFRWLRVSPFLLKESDQNQLIVQAEDVTTAKLNIEVLHTHTNKKNSILTILAHDLAGPLGAIQNFATLLSRETEDANNPKLNKIIQSIEKLSKSSIHLIHSFLDQEFLESASVNLVKKRVDLLHRIKIAYSNYTKIPNELSIKFSINANADKIYIEIDEDKFMQVINNLISNALKFTPNGGEININIDKGSTSILISITDTGIGIPEVFHECLYDKFTKARRNGLRGEISTGLGMSIIKTIVEWHSGAIWFDSKENVGTTFFIELPLLTK